MVFSLPDIYSCLFVLWITCHRVFVSTINIGEVQVIIDAWSYSLSFFLNFWNFLQLGFL